MLSILSFAATLAIAMLCSVLIVKTIRASGGTIMMALAGVCPAADPVPLRRRPARPVSRPALSARPPRAVA